MATPDLDQTLSLKASMDDGITPALQKIDKGLKTTQDALNELSQAMTAAGQKVGTAAEGMASKAGQSTEKLQGDLKDTGGAFSDLGDSAEKNSERVGQALKDSLYTRDASQRLSDLDRELGGLKGTFEGMASTARPARGKAKALQAIGKDSINKKVIPAFQELHATLDDFPDTLEDITRLQEKYTDQTGKFGGLLEGVSDRVDGFGASVDKFKFTIQDFVGGITTAYGTVQAVDVRKQQIGAGRIAGAEAFQNLPQIWTETLRESQAPISEWQGALDRLLELGRMSKDEIPTVVAGLVDMSKATQLSVDSLTDMRDQLETIGGLKADEFTGMMNTMKIMADEGRVSMEALAMAVQGSAGDLRLLSQEARKAYAENVLTTVSGIEEMGLDGAKTFEEMKAAILGSNEGLAQAVRAMGSQLGMTAEEAMASIRKGEFDKAIGAVLQDLRERLPGMLPEGAQEGLLFHHEMQGVSGAMQGIPVDPELIGALRRLEETTGEVNVMDVFKELEGGAREAAAAATGGRPEAYLETLSDTIRNTLPEIFEKNLAVAEEMNVRIGESMANVFEPMAQQSLDKFTEIKDTVIGWDDQFDRFFSEGIAYYTLATNVMTALRGVLSIIPGMGGISKMMEGGVGGAVSTVLGAVGLKKLFGGDEAPSYTLSTGEALSTKQLSGIQAALDKGVAGGGAMTADDLQTLAKQQGIPVTELRDIMVQELERRKSSGGPSILGAVKHRFSREWEGAKFMGKGIWESTPLGAAHRDVSNMMEIPGVKETLGLHVMQQADVQKQAAGAVVDYGQQRIQQKAREAKILAVEAIGGPGETFRQGMEQQLANRLAEMQIAQLEAEQQANNIRGTLAEDTAKAVELQQEHKDMAEANLKTMVERMTEVRDELRKKGQLGFRPVQVPGSQSEEDFLVQEAGR
jgi:hypothetical protein